MNLRAPDILPHMTLSVCIITLNEEVNIARTLESVRAIAAEIIVVDSGSTDRTVALAQARGAKVVTEPWKGFAAQKNSALAKATCDWILSLDADEEVSPELAASIKALLTQPPQFSGYKMNRRNLYMGRWIKRSGYYPDPKLRLIKRGAAEFELRAVHEDMKMAGPLGHLDGDLIHHAYPTLESFIQHANRYSSLGAQMVVDEKQGPVAFSFINIVVRPVVRFLYSYFFRLGFLDGREGLLVLMTHASYVSWKYAKAWEISKSSR